MELIVSNLWKFDKNYISKQCAIKPKKKDKSKKDKDATTQQNTTKKDPSKSKTFKVPQTVLDFQAVIKMMHLLHKTEIPWTDIAQANLLRAKTDFHRHMMQCAITLIHNLKGEKGEKSVDSRNFKGAFVHLTELGIVIYERCVERLEEFVDFDSTTALLATDCFYGILNLVIASCKEDFLQFLITVGE